MNNIEEVIVNKESFDINIGDIVIIDNETHLVVSNEDKYNVISLQSFSVKGTFKTLSELNIGLEKYKVIKRYKIILKNN